MATIKQSGALAQDRRCQNPHVPPGEFFPKNGIPRRITDNPAGQYHPVIFDHWIVWEDNRNTQVYLHGYNLLREAEVQLTDTPTAADAVNSPVIIPVILKETVLGDLNGDGLLDLKDAMVALKVLSGKNPQNPNEPYVIREDYVTSGVDVSGNRKIGLEELLYILQKTGGFR